MQVSDLADPSGAAYRGGVHLVDVGKLQFPIRIAVRPGAKRFFVMLNGAVDRSRDKLPVFARWNWGPILQGHVLAVCDPTLYLDPALRMGWFMGVLDQHAIPGLCAISEQVRVALKVSVSRRIFYGSSGGGFAAMLAACEVDQGKAIAINPQMNILAYHDRFVSPFIDILGGKGAAETSIRDEPQRWRVVDAWNAAKVRHLRPRFVVAQNLDDDFHYRHHFVPTMKALKVPSTGGDGAKGRIRSIIYNSPTGHGAEPPELVKRFDAEAFPFLMPPK